MDSPNNNLLLPIAIFPICFIFLWLLVGVVIARLSGWRELAQYYQDQSSFNGEWGRMRSARMRRGTNYNGCLNIGINEQGLRIETIILFRFSHPPLFIPWYDIQTTPKQLLFSRPLNFGLPKTIKSRFWSEKSWASGSWRQRKTNH